MATLLRRNRPMYIKSGTIGVISTGPGSVWFGNVVILTRPVQ